MKVRFRLGALLVAMAATVLALASPALAKGGGGGAVTAGCAQITDFSNTLSYVDGVPTITSTYAVFNGCVDEGPGAGHLPAVSFTSTNEATGQRLGTSVTFANYGPNTWIRSFPVGPTTPSLTVTVTVTAPNGKVYDTRSASLTALIQSAQAA